MTALTRYLLCMRFWVKSVVFLLSLFWLKGIFLPNFITFKQRQICPLAMGCSDITKMMLYEPKVSKETWQ